MLPNWLYGKSKSKLADILGGGGGTPADYNQVKAQVNQNTEDILLLSDGLDDKAALTQITNPNLLDNPWFTINQRLVATLTSGGKLADRWSITGNGTWEASISSDGVITIDNSENANTIYFIQKMPSDFFAKLGSKPLTASLMFSDGTIVHGSKQDATGTIYYNDDVIAITRNYQSEVMNINIKPGATVSIRAVKLEVGSVSTLAMDVAPNYETELSKCERYFMRLYGSAFYAFAIALAVNTANADFIINLPTGMISQPTVSTSGSIILTDGSNTVNLSGISIVNYIKGIASILNMRSTVETGATLTAGKVYKIAFNSTDAYIDFSADL